MPGIKKPQSEIAADSTHGRAHIPDHGGPMSVPKRDAEVWHERDRDLLTAAQRDSLDHGSVLVRSARGQSECE